MIRTLGQLVHSMGPSISERRLAESHLLSTIYMNLSRKVESDADGLALTGGMTAFSILLIEVAITLVLASAVSPHIMPLHA